jgi:hypothetical protein
MSDSPLLSKMDALLKKHRGGGMVDPSPSPSSAPPAGAWLPVLTDVIERGTPPAGGASAARPPAKPAPAAAMPATVAPVPAEDNAVAEQSLGELAPHLSEAMGKQLAEELRKNLDQIVRDAVAEKLKQPPPDPSS